LVEKFKAVVNDNSGEVTKIDLMGKRRLAYEIQKLREGQYVLMYFNGTNNAVSELNRVIGITDDVIRHIIVRHE
jgi:small subunit ribosomal protein S6